jgi:outer membrane protein assembly factor BamA
METMSQRLLPLLLLLLFTTTASAEDQIKGIEIEGLEYSNARTVERELPFEAGDVWQDEYAEVASRRLRNLGLFSEAVVLPPDDNGIVHIRVNDRWPIWLLPEATRKDNGASSAGLTMTHHNLWGLNHKLRLAVRGDTGKNFGSIASNNGISYQGSYAWRRIGDSNFGFDASFDRGSNIFDAYQNGVITSSYFQDKQSWSSGISYGFGPVPGEGWGARLGFSVDETAYSLESGPPLPDVIGLRRQAVQASTSYQLVNDHITWFTGNAFNYNLSVAHKAVGSTINSYRQTLSLREYLDIGNQNTINYRINAGWLTGDILRDGLFDVGDSSGMRGYYSGDLLGNAYAYGTLEVRHPWEINSNIQLVGFVDAGHVSLQGRNALGEALLVGVGGGVRWTLRWLVNGTLRADVAYGVATQKWRLHLGTGHSF